MAKDSISNQFSMTKWLFRWSRPYLGLLALTIGVMVLYSFFDRGRYLVIAPMINTAISDIDTDQIGGMGLPGMDRIAKMVRKDQAPEDDAEKPYRDKWENMVSLAIWAGMLTIPALFFRYFKAWLPRYLTQKMLMDIRNAVNDHLIGLSLKFHHSRKSGDVLSRVTNDINVTEQALLFLFEDIFMQPFMILFALGLAVMASWKLTLGAMIFLPIFALPVGRLGRKIRKSRSKSLEKLSDVTETMIQTYSGIRIVKAFNMEEAEKLNFHQANAAYVKKRVKVMKKKALSETIVELFYSLCLIAFIIGGGWLALESGLQPGQIGQVVFALTLMNMPLRRLIKGYNRLQESMGALIRIHELLDIQPEIKDEKGARTQDSVQTSVAFKNVSFAYDTEPVLQNVDVVAKRGEVTALVGPSGAGKSTMLDLVCRFYDPIGGTIEVDGTDIKDIQKDALLKHVAVVTQETFLFHTSVLDNIRYGRPDATREEIEEAARVANIHEFILTLPEGYDTIVGDRGSKLSGGQRQRIAIARAVLKDPAILLLDEATSALDTESERAVQEALDRIMRGPITFVIAHRLSTIVNADQIIVMQDGRVVERGRHQDLLDRNGAYARLHQIQYKESDR